MIIGRVSVGGTDGGLLVRGIEGGHGGWNWKNLPGAMLCICLIAIEGKERRVREEVQARVDVDRSRGSIWGLRCDRGAGLW